MKGLKKMKINKRPNTKPAKKNTALSRVGWSLFMLLGLAALVINLGDPRFLAFLSISLFFDSFIRH